MEKRQLKSKTFEIIVPATDILEREMESVLGGSCPNLTSCNCYDGACKGHAGCSDKGTCPNNEVAACPEKATLNRY